MLMTKKNRREVYKYLFQGAPHALPGHEQGCSSRAERLAQGQPRAAGAKQRGRATAQEQRLQRAGGPCPGACQPCTLTAACAEGVLYAEKDFNLSEHPEIPGIPNLQVIKLMQSFKSKEYVTERFAWRHYYWCGRLPAGGCRALNSWPCEGCQGRPGCEEPAATAPVRMA